MDCVPYLFCFEVATVLHHKEAANLSKIRQRLWSNAAKNANTKKKTDARITLYYDVDEETYCYSVSSLRGPLYQFEDFVCKTTGKIETVLEGKVLVTSKNFGPGRDTPDGWPISLDDFYKRVAMFMATREFWCYDGENFVFHNEEASDAYTDAISQCMSHGLWYTSFTQHNGQMNRTSLIEVLTAMRESRRLESLIMNIFLGFELPDDEKEEIAQLLVQPQFAHLECACCGEDALRAFFDSWRHSGKDVKITLAWGHYNRPNHEYYIKTFDEQVFADFGMKRKKGTKPLVQGTKVIFAYVWPHPTFRDKTLSVVLEGAAGHLRWLRITTGVKK